MDLAEIKQRQRYVWGLGDYSVLSGILEPAAVALCDACAVSAGQEVLDVAAGDGNFALAAAREGALVVASDLSPGMVERGRSRSTAEGFEIEWVEADAEELPFEDGRFDCVGSVFGAMIAPRPEVAARELFRVVRPGGTVGMTAWTPSSFLAELLELGRRYVPPPPELPAAHQWGDEGTARSRFEGLAGAIETERRSLAFEAGSPQQLVAELERSAPPQVAAREVLPEERQAAMQRDMLEIVERWNAARDGSLRIESEYLVIVARKRG